MTWYTPEKKLPKNNSLCVVIIQDSLGGSTVFTPESLLTIYNEKKWYPWSIRKGKVLYWKLIKPPTDFKSDSIIVKNECVLL
jgi:hypothetical protein